jgi:dipeptidyl aminopeptidase/acylaminoacyl peptidase
LDAITTPLLLIQGDADESVAFQETLAVARHVFTRSISHQTVHSISSVFGCLFF